MSRPLTDQDIIKMNLPRFRGVFSRDELPRQPWKNETGIMNLDIKTSSGTHWVSWVKRNKDVFYFNSYGDLRPPLEFLEYMKGFNIVYNYTRIQEKSSYLCGQLSVLFVLDPHIVTTFKHVV